MIISKLILAVSNQLSKMERICIMCEHTFLSSQELNLHQYSDLKAHIKTHAKANELVYLQCEKPFQAAKELPEQKQSYVGSLRAQKNTHNREKTYDCLECEKSFKTSHELKLHKRFHAGEKPFTCSQCDKAFLASQHLRQHQHSHNGKKPFS